MTDSRKIKVEALTRVEGEGGLEIRLNGDTIERVQLTIYEPPRFFEALLGGRSFDDVPDITARICGICPIAYQMTAVHALERALGVTVSPEMRRLRRLLYCGEWIESHTLHMHLLHAPDFFDAESGIALAERFPQEINRGLKLKNYGNELLERLGGRAIHPVNVAVGGLYRLPSRESLESLIPKFEWGLSAAIEATRWVAGFDFPDFERDYEQVALRHGEEYPLNEGRITSTSGLDIVPEDYEQHFREQHVQHSTALQSGHVTSESDSIGTPYMVGPLARVNLNFDLLGPAATKLAQEIGFEPPCLNPFRSIIARGLEVVHAYEESLEILRTYVPPKHARVPFEPQEGRGYAATEAPRGMIWHRYDVDSEGLVVSSDIVPPTSQNQRQIEEDLVGFLPDILSDDDRQTAMHCERLIRSFDPCISCSTHFLKLRVDRQ